MLTTRCIRGFLSTCSRRLVAVPEIPTVTKLEQTNRGTHYAKSYRDFTSWLNSGGHAEIFEGCSVVGKVIKVFHQVPLDKNTSLLKGEKELVEDLDDCTDLRQAGKSVTVLVVDWGHKHLGIATLSSTQSSPDVGCDVVCKLVALEHTHRTMGHNTYERHNESLLQFVRTLPV